MWHLIDMVHINIWILYHFHFRKNGKPHKNQKSLPLFSSELSDALIIASKVNLCSSREGSPKQRSFDAPTTDKKPTEALAVTDVYFDQVAHWRGPTVNKNWWRLFSMTCRVQCSKCKIFLFLLADCNFCWFPYKAIDKYIHVLTFFLVEKF